MMSKKENLGRDERGVVAIVVTVFFMMVLTLIVLAFSQAARRDQRQTLDDQLARQAFFAAESGINDVSKMIDSGVPMPSEKTDCNTGGTNLSSNGVISYSCVLYDKDPSDISDDNVNISEGETFSLSTTGGSANQVKVSWSSSGGGTDMSSCSSGSLTSYTRVNANCNPGIMRVVIIPGVSGAQTRDNLIDGMYTVFLRPISAAASVATVTYSGYNPVSTYDNQGNVVSVNCASGSCSAIVTGIPADSYIHVRSIGKPNKVSIKCELPANCQFDDAQVVIDVTGKANDVLRRLQVRRPLKSSTNKPGFALETLNGICKQLDVYPGSADYSLCFPNNVD